MNERRRACIGIFLAIALAGCDTTPSLTPPPTPYHPGPTTSSSDTAPATPSGSLSALRPIDSMTFSDVGETPSNLDPPALVAGTADGYLATTRNDQGQLLLVSDPSASSWVAIDASPLEGQIVTLTSSSGRWLLLERTFDDLGYRLWWSRDERHWFEYEQPPGLDRANEATLDGGGWGFALTYVGSNTKPGVGTTFLTSTDGQRWQSPAPDVGAPTPMPPIAVLDHELLAATIDHESEAGFAASTDGQHWEPVASLGHGGLRSNERLLAAGSRIEILGQPTESEPLRTWSGALARTGQGIEVIWSETTPSGGFGPIGFTAAAAAAGAATLLGYVPGTFAPVTWTSTGTAPWVRHALPVDTFGHGVPTEIVMSGATAVALGWDVNAAGEFLRHPWVSSGAGPWASVKTDAFGVVPTVSRAACPPVDPQEIASYLAIPAALRPVCFGNRTLHIRGYAVDCGGCGGVDPTERTPGWLNNGLQLWQVYLQAAPWSEIATMVRMGVAINPAHPIVVPPIGAFVELTGHFDDPAAATCRDVPRDPAGGIDPPSLTIARCRKEFVATGVTILAN